jgi:hypothetical protein
MRRAAPLSLAIVASMAFGCSIMGPQGSKHPGITNANPDAVIREFPTTATEMAKIMADVMGADPILDYVNMTPAGDREARLFSKAERERMGIPKFELTNDVNYVAKAKSKNGHPVEVNIRLKGESSCEVSVLYGSRGDDELSKDLLDKAQGALVNTTKDTAVTKASGSKPVAATGSKP